MFSYFDGVLLHLFVYYFIYYFIYSCYSCCYGAVILLEPSFHWLASFPYILDLYNNNGCDTKELTT